HPVVRVEVGPFARCCSMSTAAGSARGPVAEQFAGLFIHWPAIRNVEPLDKTLAAHEESHRSRIAMLRVRLKADGPVVEIRPDGSERAFANGFDWAVAQATFAADATATANGRRLAAIYARSVRARTKLTQAEFAARIGVPIETVRNWEQGKRAPRGPARA